MLYAHSKHSELSMNPIGYYKEKQILLAGSQFGAFFSYSSDIIEAPSVAICAFKIWRELLYFII
jgi:hypothetical protein